MRISSRRTFLLTGLGAVLGVRGVARYREPQVHVISIGVNKYDHELMPFSQAGSDALKVAGALKSLDSSNRYKVSTLASTRVRLKTALDALDDVAESTEPGDTLVFYFAGHGSRRNGMDYLLFSDTKPDAYATTALSVDMLGEKLATCKATTRLLIFDSGVSGFGAAAGKAPSGLAVRSAVLYACKPGQKAFEDDEGGVFTSSLVKALRSAKDSFLTVQALHQEVAGSMPVNLPRIQEPDIEGDGTIIIPIAKPSASPRLTDYPALKAYVESLRPIPAGTFQMGSSAGGADEKPVHSVTLSAFRLGATPVTFGIWKEYCKATKAPLPVDPDWGLLDDHPVVNVSWNDIMGVDGNGGFCAWASDVAGFRLSLPTEAQFEYAALGGRSGLKYPWGNSFDQSKVWCSDDVRSRKHTAAVVRTTNIFRNAYGLTDMSGNVEQWCSDVYAPYSSASQTDPQGPSSGTFRCVRGGSWLNGSPVFFRCAIRGWHSPEDGLDSLGFRLSAGPG